MTAKETKPTIKKLTVEITDEAALAEAYPELVRTETVTVRKVDRSALYPVAKALYDIGRQVPGVKAYYATDQESANGAPETAQGAAEAPKDGGVAAQEGKEGLDEPDFIKRQRAAAAPNVRGAE